jgi:hypothetical protein
MTPMKTTIPLIALVIFTLVADGQQKIQPTGMFSDMHYIPGAGDLLGTEIFITYGGGRYWAHFQESGGEPAPPQLVKVQLDENKISFDVSQDLILHSDGKETPIHNVRHFKGEIKRDRLVGTMDGLSGTYDLPRRKSYWE